MRNMGNRYVNNTCLGLKKYKNMAKWTLLVLLVVASTYICASNRSECK
jgi:hypothetical protein